MALQMGNIMEKKWKINGEENGKNGKLMGNNIKV